MTPVRKCLYCGSTNGLECVSGDGGYGQPKVYACKDVEACLRRSNRQVVAGVFTNEITTDGRPSREP